MYWCSSHFHLSFPLTLLYNIFWLNNQTCFMAEIEGIFREAVNDLILSYLFIRKWKMENCIVLWSHPRVNFLWFGIIRAALSTAKFPVRVFINGYPPLSFATAVLFLHQVNNSNHSKIIINYLIVSYPIVYLKKFIVELKFFTV